MKTEHVVIVVLVVIIAFLLMSHDKNNPISSTVFDKILNLDRSRLPWTRHEGYKARGLRSRNQIFPMGGEEFSQKEFQERRRGHVISYIDF